MYWGRGGQRGNARMSGKKERAEGGSVHNALATYRLGLAKYGLVIPVRRIELSVERDDAARLRGAAPRAARCAAATAPETTLSQSCFNSLTLFTSRYFII
eukprot:2427939-Pleurochrysis_carterae.AAC.2